MKFYYIIYIYFLIVISMFSFVYANETITETETEIIYIGECPYTDGGLRNLWIITLICVLIGIFAYIFKIYGFTLFSGFSMIILSLSFFSCGDILNYILLILGLLYIFISVLEI
jgi:hypothetical protein